jgi:hypothetical protein
MTMPKITVHKYSQAPGWKDQIGLSWKARIVGAETKSGLPQCFPVVMFRLRAGTLDAPHDFRDLRCRSLCAFSFCAARL